MNKIAKCLCDGVLGSFKSDSTGLEESSSVRAMELRDSHTGYFSDLYSIITAQARRESYRYKTHENSFSRRRSVLDENGCGSLTRKYREK